MGGGTAILGWQPNCWHAFVTACNFYIHSGFGEVSFFWLRFSRCLTASVAVYYRRSWTWVRWWQGTSAAPC